MYLSRIAFSPDPTRSKTALSKLKQCHQPVQPAVARQPAYSNRWLSAEFFSDHFQPDIEVSIGGSCLHDLTSQDLIEKRFVLAQEIRYHAAIAIHKAQSACPGERRAMIFSLQSLAIQNLTILLAVCSIALNAFVLQAATQEKPPAKASAIDVLQTEMAVGLIANDLTRLRENLTSLTKDTPISIEGTMIDSFFYNAAGFSFNINKTFDRRGPGGIFANNIEGDWVPWLSYPLRSTEAASKALSVDLGKKQFQGKVLALSNRQAPYVLLKDRQLSLAMNWLGSTNRQRVNKAEIVDGILEQGRTLRSFMPEVQQSKYDSCDAVLMLSAQKSREFWGAILGQLFEPGKSDDEPGLLEKFSAAGDELVAGLARIDLKDGIHIQTESLFDPLKENIASHELIEQIRGGDQPSDLNLLPSGDYILAAAAKGHGQQNAALAKGLIRTLVRNIAQNGQILDADSQVEFYQQLGVIWEQLNGTRLAVYRTKMAAAENGADADPIGVLVAVAIFETEQPRALLNQVAPLMDFVNRSLEKQRQPIRFRYRKNAGRLGGHRVDHLTIDSQRLPDKQREQFEKFLGPDAATIQLVQLENQIVALAGSHQAFFERAVADIVAGKPGLGADPALQQSQAKIDARRKIEMHVSMENIGVLLLSTRGRRNAPRPYKDPQAATSVGFIFEQDRLGLDFWLPKSEFAEVIRMGFNGVFRP